MCCIGSWTSRFFIYVYDRDTRKLVWQTVVWSLWFVKFVQCDLTFETSLVTESIVGLMLCRFSSAWFFLQMLTALSVVINSLKLLAYTQAVLRLSAFWWELHFSKVCFHLSHPNFTNEVDSWVFVWPTSDGANSTQFKQ